MRYLTVAAVALASFAAVATAQTSPTPAEQGKAAATDTGERIKQGAEKIGEQAKKIGEAIKNGAVDLWEASKTAVSSGVDKFNERRSTQK
jgi:hypothetical protein